MWFYYDNVTVILLNVPVEMLKTSFRKFCAATKSLNFIHV